MKPASPDDDGGQDAFEDDDGRELCPDGGCVGLIGADGRCKECGREAEPVEDDSDNGGYGHDYGHDYDEQDDDDDGGDGNGDDDGFEERRLCPDGGCIGLIGADGRCKECGTAAN
jgi:hypothetical protein